MRVTKSAQLEIMSILIFISGMSGLFYEVIWFKQFSHVWGSSSSATSSVVVAFLMGIGLGAVFGGYLSERVKNFVFWYGAIEVGIGIFALLIPWETDFLWQYSVRYYSSLREHSILYALVRCATTFALIGPSCILMGATIPTLIRHFSIKDVFDDAIGWLYGLNTLGAAVGCYMVGFHVLPSIGLFWSNVLAACFNLVVGTIAMMLSRRSLDQADATASNSMIDSILKEDLERRPLIFAHRLYATAAVSGCAALILQSIWTRQMALVLGSSTYAFSAMLFVLLASMGIGSLVYRFFAGKVFGDVSTIVFVVAFIVMSSIVGIRLLPITSQCVGALIPLRANDLINGIVCVFGSLILQFLPGFGMGVLFPLLVNLVSQNRSTLGSVVGKVYAWNTAGSIIGCLFTTVCLIPQCGLHFATVVALALYICVPLIANTSFSKGKLKTLAVLCSLMILLVFFARSPEDARKLNMGMFLYGYHSRDSFDGEVLFFKEGATSNVLVTKQDGDTSFRVNGKVDGGSQGDMSMQLGLAYFPLFLNPNAEEVLVVGFGTGTSSGASLLFPDTSVTCCELEPVIIAAAKHFSEVNHQPQDSPRFKVIFDDARSYIQGTDQIYDVILSEPSNPWIAGVSNLFTREFYQQSRKKLSRNGIFAQWIQMYSFTSEDYAMIVRTMSDVFPHRQLIRVSNGDTILLGSNEPLLRDPEVINASTRIAASSKAIQSDLGRYFAFADVRSLLLAHIVLDDRGLSRLMENDGRKSQNSDENLQLEFRAARQLYKVGGTKPDVAICNACSAEWFIENFKQMECGEDQLLALHGLIQMLVAADRHEEAKDVVEFGYRLAPQSATMITDRLVIHNALGEELDKGLLRQLFETKDELVAEEASRLGVYLWSKQKYADASAVFERLASHFPDSATTWTNLAINYNLDGHRDKALSTLRHAKKLDPINNLVITQERRLEKEARSHFQK